MNCIFCKIIKGEIPSIKIVETNNVFAFMDINPLSDGHSLFIPKIHSESMNDLSEAASKEILGLIKSVAISANIKNYNVLLNNGSLAGQEVFHTHFHLIPKTETTGLEYQFNRIDDKNQATIAKKIRDNLII